MTIIKKEDDDNSHPTTQHRENNMPHRKNKNINLDFSIPTSEQREEAVTQLLSTIPEKLSSNDLSLLADYILYGKDAQLGTSTVDRKEVEITPKHNSYTKAPPKSLEDLLSNPAFDETLLKPLTQKSIYLSPKKVFSREKNAHVAPLYPIWREIDKMAAKIDYFSGKKQLNDFAPEIRDYLAQSPHLDSYGVYKLRHALIDLRREQFAIQDCFAPVIPNLPCQATYNGEMGGTDIRWQDEEFPVYPMGLLMLGNPNFVMYNEKDSFFAATIKNCDTVAAYVPKQPKGTTKFYLDFTDAEHIYNLVKFYEELEISCLDDPDSTIRGIVDTLDFYAAAANLTEDRQEILTMKKQKYTNVFIRDYVNEKYGRSYTSSYISTIFKNQVCKDIAEAAQLHYDSFLHRFNVNDFKRCNCCGKLKLKDTRNFARKARSNDGLSARCKQCDRDERRADRRERLLRKKQYAEQANKRQRTY